MGIFTKKEKKEKEPQYIPSPMNNRMINYKVYYMGHFEKLLYSLLVCAIGGVVGYIFYGGLFKVDGEATNATKISNLIVFLLAGLVARKYFLPAINKALHDKRAKALQKQFMDMLESLSASLSSGNTLVEAFRNSRRDLANQYDEDAYILTEVEEVLNGIDNNMTLETMMDAFGKRSNNEDIQNFANVIANCNRLGGDFADVVRKTRNIIADKIAIEEEINTKLSSNKLQLNAMCLMPIGLVALLKLSIASFAENLASLLGVVVTTIAVAMFITGYFWGQKIINIK